MKNTKREFVINDLIVPGFIMHKGCEILLEELDDTGKSKLLLKLSSEDNLCIANVDKKKTDILYFQKEKEKSLYKRVDHMVFERKENHKWKLYLIEMKGSVGAPKWIEIKGKFRDSYLFAQAIASMLEIEISETVMYTTFERVEFGFSDTMPSARRGRQGEPAVRMEDEWNGTRFGLNFGKRISFLHIPIKMERDNEGVLTGCLREDYDEI
jgi:hypothetical protein